MRHEAALAILGLSRASMRTHVKFTQTGAELFA
jgi:hypothetical protein